MTVSLPFSGRPMRQVGTSLPDSTLDRIDALRMMIGMPSRSAFLAELIELGVELYENPASAIGQMIDGLEQVFADAETDAAPGPAGQLDLRSPS